MSTASNEEIGAVIGGMIAWDHAIQNSLTDSHLEEAIDWAKRFRDLYEHYESMKMSGR